MIKSTTVYESEWIVFVRNGILQTASTDFLTIFKMFMESSICILDPSLT